MTTLAMTEAQFQSAVLDLARVMRWRTAHFRPAMNANGHWRTAVSGDGAGFPDLVLARRGRIIFAELKSDTGRLRPEQREWLIELRACTGVETFVWRPQDWDAITEVLR